MSTPEEEQKKKEFKPENIPEGEIRKIGNNLNSDSSQMDLLDSFLKQITGIVQVQQKSKNEDIEDIHSYELSEYPDIESVRHVKAFPIADRRHDSAPVPEFRAEICADCRGQPSRYDDLSFRSEIFHQGHHDRSAQGMMIPSERRDS